MEVKDKIAVIGVGCTKFGDNFEMSYADMVIEATLEACQDAGIELKEIQAGWLGTAFPDSFGFEGRAGMSLAESLALENIPITRVSNYCAAGMDAFRNACFSILAGVYEIALVVGVEKMRDLAPRDSLIAQAVKTLHPTIGKGRTAPGVFALYANRYFKEYGIDKSVLAKVAVKNHHNGSLNPKAHFQNEITEEMVLKAPLVVDPLGLLDCCPTTDGAAAAIITKSSRASKFKSDPILLKGINLAVSGGDRIFFDPHLSFLGFESTVKAAQGAYRMAGIKNPRTEINIAEVHDCFTITEILNYEDLGFCDKGEGSKFIVEGISKLDGDLPVNPSGGLKTNGHPIGATGVRQIYELTIQLRGKAGKRQVKKAKMGLAHNLGGPGTVASVCILGI